MPKSRVIANCAQNVVEAFHARLYELARQQEEMVKAQAAAEKPKSAGSWLGFGRRRT